MSEENIIMLSDNQGNVDTSESKGESLSKKSQEVWGNREGRKHFKFSTDKVKDIEGLPVHPYLYKIKEQNTIEGKEVIVLQLNGQEEERKFYKEDLDKYFPGKKQHVIYCTKEEVEIVKKFLKEILRDEECLKIFEEHDISVIKEAITSLI